jgi:uncharacterized metal-binding protein
MNKTKVVIIPCSGIGKPLGTVARQATYDLVEKVFPERAATTCLALLVSGDADAVRLVKESPCIALDGCAKECARRNIEIAGGKVESELRMMDVFRENKDFKPETVLDIGEGGEKLAGETVRRVAAEVERILKERGQENE